MTRARMARALVACGLMAAAAHPAAAGADTYETSFEQPAFAAGALAGQDGWSLGVPILDAEIAAHSGWSQTLGLGAQSLRMSNGLTSGGFDQVRSPTLAEPATEAGSSTFEASFTFAAAGDDPQPGLSMHVSPDSGDGSRMAGVRIEDGDGGLLVRSLDPADRGPGQAVLWQYAPIALGLDRGEPHTLRFAIDLVPGPANDVTRIYVDGRLAHTAPSWEQYYRNDPEQAVNGNAVPPVGSLLLVAHSTWDGLVPSLAGAGLFFDDLRLESVTPPPQDPPRVDPPGPPAPPAPKPNPKPKPEDDTPPRLSVGGSAAARDTLAQSGFLRKRSVSLPLGCSERCTVRASGRLSLRRGGKRIELKLVRRTVRAGGRATVRLRLSPRTRAALRGALRDGRRVTATVVLQVRDAAGNTRTVRRTIRLKR
jgi:hypothetical protein